MSVEITESLLAHIHNDRRLKGTYGLTGHSPKNTVAFLAEFIEEQKSSNLLIPTDTEQLLSALKTLDEQERAISSLRLGAFSIKDTKPLAKDWFRLIQSTKADNNDYLLLPGGWLHSTGGHYIVYQFHRDTSGDIIFTIHNSGAGLRYHAKRSEADKELHSPTLQYRIPRDQAEKQRDFVPILQQLIVAKISSLHDKETIDAKFLYKNVFEKLHFLGAEIIEPKKEDYQYFTGGQLSGTCGQRSLHQMLKARFKSVDDYRKFIFSFKLYALKRYMEKMTREDCLGDKKYHPQIEGAINHLLRLVNVKKDNSDEPLFPVDTREKHRQQILEYASLLEASLTKTKSKSESSEDRSNKYFEFHFRRKDVTNYTDSSATVKPILFDPKPTPLIPSRLSLSMDTLEDICKDLIRQGQYNACFEKLEQFFLQLPLPDSGHSGLLPFYRSAGIAEHPQLFFKKLDSLQELYFTAGKRALGDGTILPRMITIKASNFSVCTHICQNIDYLGASYFANAIENILISLNLHNGRAVQLSHHNAALDKRLHQIRRLHPGNEWSRSSAFPKSYQDKMIEHYNRLIARYPSLKKNLERKFELKYALNDSAMIRTIRDNECRALYYWLTNQYRDSELSRGAEYKDLHSLFEEQKQLERTFARGLSQLWGNNDRDDDFSLHYITNKNQLLLKSTIQSGNNHFFLSSSLEESIYGLEDGIVKDCLSYYMNQASTLNAASLGPTNSSKVQLKRLSSQKAGEGDISQQDFEERELYHLRHNPDHQIILTLEYFLKHPEKLKRRDMQIYCEANLFEGGVLYKLMSQPPGEDFWELLDKFVMTGIDYSQKQGLHTKQSIFYIHLLESLNNYAVECAPEQNGKRLKSLIDKLNLWIKQPQPPEELAALHLFRFKCLNTIFQLDAKKNETDIIDIFESYFIFQTHPVPEAYNDADGTYRLKQTIRSFMYGMKTEHESLPWKAILNKLSAAKLLPKSEKWNEKMDINYSDIHLSDVDGHKYHINLLQGFILRDGMALVQTPLNILNHPIIAHLNLKDARQCYQTANQKQFIVEKNDIKLRFTQEDDNLYIEQSFPSSEKESTWYQLLSSNDQQNTYLNLPYDGYTNNLPAILQQRGLFIWRERSSNKNLIITDSTNQIRYTLTNLGYDSWEIRRKHDDALIYCSKPEFERNFTGFESEQFMIISEDKFGNVDCQLPRYNLHFHKKAASDNFLWHWDNSDYILDDKQPLQQQGLPALTFDNQMLCVLPITRFLSTNTRQEDSDYYQFKADTDNKITEDVVKRRPKDDDLPFAKPLVWQHNGSRKAMVMKMHDGKPYPETPAQALYLCYVYLCTHQEEKALQVLEACDKRLGGLIGNYEELQYLQWICKALPYCRQNNDEDNEASISNPPVVACQLKAIQLWARLNERSQKVTFPDVVEKPNNPDEHYQRQTVKSIQRFHESGLNKQIFKLYDRYQLMRRDMGVDFVLTESESRCLLNFYHSNLPQSSNASPKAIGSLGYDWLRLNIINLKRELDHLNQTATIRLLTDYEIARKKDIQSWIESHEGVYQTRSKLIKSYINLDIHDHPGLEKCKLASLSFLEVFPANIDRRNLHGIQKQLDTAMSLLTPGIEDNQFESNFGYYLAIALKNNEQTETLELFCKAYLRASRHTQIDKQPNNIPYLCNVLYRVISHKKSNFFTHGRFSTLERFCEHVNGMEPIPIHIYQLEDTTDMLLTHAIDIEKSIPETPLSVHPEVSGKQLSKIEDLCLYPKAVSAKFKDSAARWQALEHQFYHIEDKDIEFDADDSIGNEKQAGQLKFSILSQLQSQARKQFSNQESISTLKEQTNVRLKELQKTQSDLEQTIITLANTGPVNPGLKVSWNIDIAANRRKPLDMYHLIGLYFKDDMLLYRQSTGLSDDNIHILHGQIAEFLKRGLHIQQLKRILSESNQLTKLPYDSLTNAQLYKLGRAFFATNLSDVVEEPAISVFQYYENKLLRPHQHIGIQKLLQQSPDGQFKEIVAKVVMGGGKSKVFSPLLAYLKAKGDNLVLLEVPKALLRTNYTDLKAMSNQLFGQTAELFEFSRDSDCSPKALKALFQFLTDVMVNKKYLVTTGESIQSLELKYLELLESKPKSSNPDILKEWEEQVTWAEKLVLLLKNRGDCIIDEIHEGLLLKNRLNYTIGPSKSVPKFISNEVVALYQFLQHVSLDKIDGIPSPSLTMDCLLAAYKPIKTKKQFEQACELLADELLKHEQSPLLSALKRNKITLNASEKMQLKSYFFDQCDEIPSCVLSLPEDLQDIVALYKEQVSHLLPFTLKRNTNEHFGPSKNKLKTIEQRAVAIPYSANNSPNEHSNFGNEIESINYTIQSMKINGVPEALLEQYLQFLLQQAKADAEENKIPSLDDTVPGNLYHSMTKGLSLSALDIDDQSQLEQLHQTIAHNDTLIYEVLKNLVLPNIRINHNVLSSNALNHVDMMHSVQGYSGTPWNASTFNQRLKYDKALANGTDAYIIESLVEKDTPVNIIDFSQPDKLVDNLLSQYQGSDIVRSIIDISAAFKGISNEDVVRKIARFIELNPERFNKPEAIKHVLFFNEHNQLCALPVEKKGLSTNIIIIGSSNPDVIEEKLGCSADARFTYYDQAHTLGADISQGDKAKAIALVDEETTISKFTQGEMRFREILTGQQTTDIFVPLEMAEMRHNLSKLCHHMQAKEKAQLRQDNYTAARLKIANFVRNDLLKRILNYSGSATEKADLLEKFNACFIEKQSMRLFKRFGNIAHKEKTRLLLEHFERGLLDNWANMLKEADIDFTPVEQKNLAKQMDNVIDYACQPGICDEEQDSTDKRDAMEVELYTKIEVQEERLVEKYDQSLKESEFEQWYGNPHAELDLNIKTLQSIVQSVSPSYTPDFSENIQATRNFYKVYRGQKTFLTQKMLPVHGIFFHQGKDGLQCLLLSPEELKEATSYIESSGKTNYWVSTTNHTVLSGEMPKSMRQNPQYQSLIEQIRFFAGDLSLLTKRDAPLTWLNEKTGKKLDFYETHLAPARESNLAHLQQLRIGVMMLDRMIKFIADHPDRDFLQFDWKAQFPAAEDSELNEIKEVAKAFLELSGSWWHLTITAESLVKKYNLSPMALGYLSQYEKSLRAQTPYFNQLKRLISTLHNPGLDPSIRPTTFDNLVEKILAGHTVEAKLAIEQIDDSDLYPLDVWDDEQFVREMVLDNVEYVSSNPKLLLSKYLARYSHLNMHHLNLLINMIESQPSLCLDLLRNKHAWQIEPLASIFIAVTKLPMNQRHSIQTNAKFTEAMLALAKGLSSDNFEAVIKIICEQSDSTELLQIFNPLVSQFQYQSNLESLFKYCSNESVLLSICQLDRFSKLSYESVQAKILDETTPPSIINEICKHDWPDNPSTFIMNMLSSPHLTQTLFDKLLMRCEGAELMVVALSNRNMPFINVANLTALLTGGLELDAISQTRISTLCKQHEHLRPVLEEYLAIKRPDIRRVAMIYADADAIREQEAEVLLEYSFEFAETKEFEIFLNKTNNPALISHLIGSTAFRKVDQSLLIYLCENKELSPSDIEIILKHPKLDANVLAYLCCNQYLSEENLNKIFGNDNIFQLLTKASYLGLMSQPNLRHYQQAIILNNCKNECEEVAPILFDRIKYHYKDLCELFKQPIVHLIMPRLLKSNHALIMSALKTMLSNDSLEPALIDHIAKYPQLSGECLDLLLQHPNAKQKALDYVIHHEKDTIRLNRLIRQINHSHNQSRLIHALLGHPNLTVTDLKTLIAHVSLSRMDVEKILSLPQCNKLILAKLINNYQTKEVINAISHFADIDIELVKASIIAVAKKNDLLSILLNAPSIKRLVNADIFIDAFHPKQLSELLLLKLFDLPGLNDIDIKAYQYLLSHTSEEFIEHINNLPAYTSGIIDLISLSLFGQYFQLNPVTANQIIQTILHHVGSNRELISILQATQTLPLSEKTYQAILLHPKFSDEILTEIEKGNLSQAKAIKTHLRLYQQCQDLKNELAGLETLANEGNSPDIATNKTRNAALSLHKALSQEVDKLMDKKNGLINQTRIQDLHNNCQSILGDKKLIDQLKEHPHWWYRVKPIIRNILGIISAMLIIPALAVHVASNKGYQHVFFNTPITEGERKLTNVEDKIGVLIPAH